MTWRQCNYPGCPALTKQGKCEYHRAREKATKDRKHGTARQRYGPGWEKIAKRILVRDRYVCHWCHGTATTADHLIALVDGGGHEDWNLVAACQPCNSRRGAQLVARRAQLRRAGVTETR